MADASTTELQGLMDRLAAGDPGARNELIDRACQRLRRLTRRISQDFPRLRRLEETDDVLNNAVLRLLRRLQAETRPTSVPEFFRTAAREIRCELLDLVKHHFGPEGAAARERDCSLDSSESRPLEKSTSTYEPATLAAWTEFHEQVERLPDEERAVVDLLWYQGLTQAEAAALLGVAGITVKRRWAAARLRLGATLPDACGPA